MRSSRLPRPFELAYRWLAASIVIAVAWDNMFYVHVLRVHAELPLRDAYFPSWITSPALAALLLAAYALSNLTVAIVPSAVLLRANALVTLLCSVGLLIGPYLFARQTFVITVWAGVWMVWVAYGGTEDTEHRRRLGAGLALAIVSLVFFAAMVGKLTQGYWSGLVLGTLFFGHSDPKFALLRESLSAEQLPLVARYYSRVALIGEATLAAAVFLPLRVGLIVAFLLLAGMWLLSPRDIINAIAPAVGLVIAGGCLVLLRPGEARAR